MESRAAAESSRLWAGGGKQKSAIAAGKIGCREGLYALKKSSSPLGRLLLLAAVSGRGVEFVAEEAEARDLRCMKEGCCYQNTG